MARKLSALQLPLFDLNNYGEVTGGLEPDNSIILRKSTKARICLEKAQTYQTLQPGQTVIDFMLQLTCYSAYTFYLPTPHPKVFCLHIAMLPGVAIVKILENDL